MTASGNAREIDGCWWFPPSDARAYGTLRITRREIRLKLVDSAGPLDTQEMLVVHGEDLEGNPITLLDAYVTNSTRYVGAGHNVERLRANAVLIGAHVMSADDVSFTKARIRYRGLREWMTTRWRRYAAFKGEQPQSLAIEDATARLTLCLERSEHLDPIRAEELTQWSAYVDVELDDPISFPEWSELWIRPLLDLLVFATREQVVIESLNAISIDPDRVAGVHPAIRRSAADEFWATRSIEIIRPDVVDIRDHGITPFEHMLLPLAALRGREAETLIRFFRLHEALGAAATLLFGTLNTRRIYQENRLLNLLSFAEDYHRTLLEKPVVPDKVHQNLVRDMLNAVSESYRDHYGTRLKYANEQSQRQRLGEIIQRAKEVIPELPKEPAVLKNELIDTRNHYTHFGEPGKHILGARDLYSRIELLVEILEVNLLLDLGIEPQLIRELIANTGR
jgi:hypothetical protein